MIRKVLIAALTYLNLTACTTTSEQKSVSMVEVDSSEKALQDQLNWILQVLNEKAGKVSKEEIQAHFHQTFLAQMSADQVPGIFAQLASQLGKLQLMGTDASSSPAPGVRTAVSHVSAQSGKFRIVLSVDSASGLINGLFVQPDTEQKPLKPLSFEDAQRKLQSVTPDSGFLVAEVQESGCNPVFAFNAEQTRAIGSSFKAYLLYALYNQARVHKVRWDDNISIRTEWKSLPSGTMQYAAAGTQFRVEKFAEEMISRSDNTATDHLFYTLGRENIEAIMRNQFSPSEKNFPLLSTREFFFLKLREDMAKAWISMDMADKGQFISTKQGAGFQLSTDSTWVSPRAIDEIEWFASPRELCQLLGEFREGKGADSDLTKSREILSKNPGISVPPGTFRYLGFKGGSEPGVLSLNWLVQRSDKRWFAVTFAANDRKSPLPEELLVNVAGGILLSVASLP